MNNVQAISYSMIYEYLLGTFPTANTYDDRIIGQKIGYLSQSYGVYIGDIKFFWNKRGPYSRVLTKILYGIDKNKELIIQESSGFGIKLELKNRLDKLKEIIDSKPMGCPKVIWLEILASIKFISDELTSNEPDVIIPVLKKRKSFLNQYSYEIEKASSLVL